MKNALAPLALALAFVAAMVAPEVAQSVASHTAPAHETLVAYTIEDALAQCETLDIEFKSDCVDAAHATIWK